MTPKASILSTRPLSQDVLDQAAANDIEIEVISFIRTEPLPYKGLPNSRNVVFTSVNAVEAVASIVKPRAVFCIGNSTAKLVTDQFGVDIIKGTAESAAALADVIIQSGVKDVVFFCGDQRRGELPDKLAANNIAVTEITVYRTIATPAKIKKDYTAILFFSPSAAESFFSENKINGNTILFAIGHTTATTIKKFSTNQVIIGEEPVKDALALKAIKHLVS